MKVFVFAFFAPCVFMVPAIGQDKDCDTLEKCREVLKVTRNSSLAHFRMGEIFLQLQSVNECKIERYSFGPARTEGCENYVSAANEFLAVFAGDLQPEWTKVWAHINLGKVYDAVGMRERALNEYRIAVRTKDNTRGAQDEAAKYKESPFKPN